MPRRFGLQRGVLVLGALSLFAQPQATIETLRGRFGIYIEDRFEHRTSTTHYTLETGREQLELILRDSRAAEGVRPGSDVEVSGRRQGRLFLVSTA